MRAEVSQKRERSFLPHPSRCHANEEECVKRAIILTRKGGSLCGIHNELSPRDISRNCDSQLDIAAGQEGFSLCTQPIVVTVGRGRQSYKFDVPQNTRLAAFYPPSLRRSPRPFKTSKRHVRPIHPFSHSPHLARRHTIYNLSTFSGPF